MIKKFVFVSLLINISLMAVYQNTKKVVIYCATHLNQSPIIIDPEEMTASEIIISMQNLIIQKIQNDLQSENQEQREKALRRFTILLRHMIQSKHHSKLVEK
jgi:hypothetical protein